jgi:tRNA pseudouridine55 synthase
MSEVIKLYKNIGETPLKCLLDFKKEHPEYQDKKMTYLGRLDPMAEGLLLVALGSVDKQKYLSLDKTYEFEVLWGMESDTYDVLGLIIKVRQDEVLKEQQLMSVVKKVKSTKSQSYPPYSSRTVAGRPLWEIARENKIDEIEIPARGIKIFSIEHISTRHMTGAEILKQVQEKVALAKGDFRQAEIVKKWQEELNDLQNSKFLVSKFVADVSSGTYVRGLAHEMGKMLEIGALAWSIKRTRVGEHTLQDF